jgi:LysM repeat protein
VSRICPFLALGDDLRTAIDGFDAEHRCLALDDAPVIDRMRQAQFCLSDAHIDCERFKERLAAINEERHGRSITPDARFLSTRLILESEPRWRRRPMSPARVAWTRQVAAGGAAVVLLTGIAAASTNAFGLLADAPEKSSPTDQPAPGTASASPSAEETERLFVAATPSPPAAQTPTPRPTPAATPKPTRRVYVVQLGDTLDAIAVRYGTTISALMAANGLGSDLINVGQVLVIP